MTCLHRMRADRCLRGLAGAVLPVALALVLIALMAAPVPAQQGGQGGDGGDVTVGSEGGAESGAEGDAGEPVTEVETATVTVKVVAKGDGAPVADAVVWLENRQTRKRIGQAIRADETGTATFSGVPRIRIRAHAEKANEFRRDASTKKVNGATASLVVKLEPE